MQKTDLIKAVAEKTGMTQVTTGKVINAVIDLITDTLKKGDEKITLTGFGTFEVRTKRNAWAPTQAHGKRSRFLPARVSNLVPVPR